MIDSQFGKPIAAGVKRKRQIQDHSLSSGIPQHVSERSLINRTPPPTYQAPEVPKLGPISTPENVLEVRDELPENAVWSSLDELIDALPAPTSNPNEEVTRDKGKQRALNDLDLGDSIWETASSIGTTSTATSSDSLREGSILSTASRERTFDEGTCTMLVNASTPGAQPLVLPIAHLEIKRTAQGQGRGIVIIARTTGGQEVADNLWLPSWNENAKPFLEHDDIVGAMRHSAAQRNFARPGENAFVSNSGQGVVIAAVVFFAPHPSKHPQYAFSTIQDAWDFVSATSTANDLHNPDLDWSLSLVCSASVTSVKSALTHGNVEESSHITLQVWERDPDPTATAHMTQAQKQQFLRRRTHPRFIRVFRNKSPLANSPAPPVTATSAAFGGRSPLSVHMSSVVLDVDCKFLKAPEPERRSGKVLFTFRDTSSSGTKGLVGALRGMRYLKVAFRDDEAKREFLYEAGFGA
jgi:hypothetical protein